MGQHSPKKNPRGKRGARVRTIEPGVASKGSVSGAISDPSSRRRGPLESAPARLKAEADRRKQRRKRIAAIAGVSVIAVALVVAGVLALYARDIQNKLNRSVDRSEKLDVSLQKSKPQEPFNMLLVGFDRRPEETVYRSDTMMLVHIDPKTKQVWMLSLPRDLKVSIPGEGTHKLNQAYALGGENLTIETVQKLTGVPIHHFMAVNFSGFKHAVDAMGGVWVDVPAEIDDWKADASPGHRAKHIDAGYQLLDGDHALTFVRSRDYPDADFTRMKNQQLFLRAVMDQATKTSVVAMPKLVSSVAPYVSTDMSLMELLKTAQALRGAGSKNLYTATIPGEWRSPYIHPDEEGMAALLDKFKNGVPFESALPTETASPDSGGTGTVSQPASAKKPSEINVAIRNGGGVSGSAKQAASILRARNFDVGEVGNAAQFIYEETLVVYRDDKAAAELVASVLPSGARTVASRGMYSFTGDVLVVIGKDWDLSKVPVAPINTN